MGAYDFNCANCGRSGAGRPTGGSTLAPTGWVWNKSFGFGRKAFCSNRCLDEFNQRNKQEESSSSDSKKYRDNFSNSTRSSYNDAEKIRAEAEADRLEKEFELQIREKMDARIREIASMDFGGSKDSVYNVLDQLVIIGSSKPSPKERKAIVDKMEIGIMRLKNMGEINCSFYEEKMLKIKPTIWHKLLYYFENN
jgi:hypothetical protein